MSPTAGHHELGGGRAAGSSLRPGRLIGDQQMGSIFSSNGTAALSATG